jgi:hypothetical protein
MNEAVSVDPYLDHYKCLILGSTEFIRKSDKISSTSKEFYTLISVACKSTCASQQSHPCS